MAILRSLNPRARIVVSQFGQVPLGNILNTGLFDFEQAAQHPAGKRTPGRTYAGDRRIWDHQLCLSRPPAFHPTRFWQVMENELDGVVRSKVTSGWPAVRKFAGSWSRAGGIAAPGLGACGGLVCRKDVGQDAESLKFIMSNWIDGIGDARQNSFLLEWI